MEKKHRVYWLTGLSGAGKTTIGGLFYRRLKARKMTDCIVTKEEISKDALKKYGEDTVNAVGATWKETDVFGYELNLARLEQIKSGT